MHESSLNVSPTHFKLKKKKNKKSETIYFFRLVNNGTRNVCALTPHAFVCVAVAVAVDSSFWCTIDIISYYYFYSLFF